MDTTIIGLAFMMSGIALITCGVVLAILWKVRPIKIFQWIIGEGEE